MASIYSEIRDLLARQERCFRELHELQVREREYLVQLNTEALDEGNNRKETLGLRVRALEETRVRLCGTVAAEHGVDPADVTLTFLCEHCEPELADDFRRFANGFRALARKLESVTRSNGKLVQSSLNTARNMERLLRKLISDQPTYDAGGQMGTATQRSRLMIGTL